MEEFSFLCIKSRIEHNRSFYGCFECGPFLPGQGITVGNSLRRSLLSELPGLAITEVEIKNVSHEYSTIPGARESVLELLLNLKEIVFCSNYKAITPQIGFLQVQGPCNVTAADLKLPLGINCVDPTQHIAALSYNGFLNIKFLICQGKGYAMQTPLTSKWPDKASSSVLSIDAVFMPVKQVNFVLQPYITKKQPLLQQLTQTGSFDSLSELSSSVQKKTYGNEEVATGYPTFAGSSSIKNLNRKEKLSKQEVVKKESQKEEVVNSKNQTLQNESTFQINTTQEKIVIEIWTNGSIHPREAISKAAYSLIRMFLPFTKQKAQNLGYFASNKKVVNNPKSAIYNLELPTKKKRTEGYSEKSKIRKSKIRKTQPIKKDNKLIKSRFVFDTSVNSFKNLKKSNYLKGANQNDVYPNVTIYFQRWYSRIRHLNFNFDTQQEVFYKSQQGVTLYPVPPLLRTQIKRDPFNNKNNRGVPSPVKGIRSKGSGSSKIKGFNWFLSTSFKELKKKMLNNLVTSKMLEKRFVTETIKLTEFKMRNNTIHFGDLTTYFADQKDQKFHNPKLFQELEGQLRLPSFLEIDQTIYGLDIANLDLEIANYSLLKRAQINTIGQLVQKTSKELFAIIIAFLPKNKNGQFQTNSINGINIVAQIQTAVNKVGLTIKS